MHYTLEQCKEFARHILMPQATAQLFSINLDHTMPWPSDDQIKAVMLEEAKSKKKAATLLGITRRCLRRRLHEIKTLGGSITPGHFEPLSVRQVLERLLRNQSFQQISEETEVHQAWLCRLVTILIELNRSYAKAPVKHRIARYSITGTQSGRLRSATPNLTSLPSGGQISLASLGEAVTAMTNTAATQPWIRVMHSINSTNTAIDYYSNPAADTYASSGPHLWTAIDFTDPSGDVES